MGDGTLCDSEMCVAVKKKIGVRWNSLREVYCGQKKKNRARGTHCKVRDSEMGLCEMGETELCKMCVAVKKMGGRG